MWSRKSTAAAIRRFVTAYLDRDVYMAGKGPTGYRIYSLYFDTLGLRPVPANHGGAQESIQVADSFLR